MILLAHSYYLQRDSKQFARMKPYPPLATLLAAAVLREQGHEVALFDATFASGVADFEQALERADPSAMILMEDNFNFLTKMCTVTRRGDALAMIRAAAERGCRVAVNGPDPSDQPALYLSAGAEALVLGEGEMGLAEVADAWRAGQTDLEPIGGLVTPGDDGELRHSRSRPPVAALDALPLPAWDLIDVADYRQAWAGAHGYFSWNMATSRGCPYRCNWCAKPTFGRRYTQRSPQSVAREMQRLKREVAPDHIWFADDIFGLSADWIIAFADEVERRDVRTRFMMQSRVNLMSPDAVAALARAGAEEVWLGVESGSQKILDAMDKGSTVQSARNATRTLQAGGIRVGWFIQLGYPSESWDDILATRDLLRDEAPDDIGISVAYPLPGTKFYDRVSAQLGARRNWRDTGDLAMLFQGTYDTAFYRQVRDLLHAEAVSPVHDDRPWAELSRRAADHRSPEPIHV